MSLVLVIDDNETMRSGMALLLERMGHAPCRADHTRVKLPISFKDEPRMNTNRHEYRWTSFAAMPSRNEAHPGARASRPHAPPSRAAQYVYDVAAGNPGSGNGVGLGEADPWRVCRSSGVEEMREAVRRPMRAGRPRSRVGLLRCGFADSRHWKLAVS